MNRTSINSKIIQADCKAVYQAFTDKKALEFWLAPNNMKGKIHHFEFRVGGKYEMSLFYNDSGMEGKTSGNEDRFSATFTEIIPYKKIVQTIHFQSDNRDFQDEMMMEVQLDYVDTNATEVTIIFKNIPTGVDPKVNEEGTEQSLEKLAQYVERTY